MKKLILLVLAAAVVTGVYQGVASSGETQTSVNEQSIEQQLEQTLQDEVKGELLNVTGQFVNAPYSFQVDFLAQQNLTNGMTYEGMLISIREALYAAKNTGEPYSDIRINVKLEMAEGEEYVIKSEFQQEAIDSLPDEEMALNTDQLEAMASEWWEHDAIQ